MKVRQLLGWTRPATPTDMAMQLSSSQSSRKGAAPSSASNNREHEHEEMVYSSFEDMSKLSIDELPTPEPNAPRAGNNNFSKEMKASHLAASSNSNSNKSDGDNPEEPEDKATADTISSPSGHGATEKGTSRPRTSRCSSDDSSNSSTASSSRSPSGGAVPTSSGSLMNAATAILSPTASPPPKVTFRKGEKSFLDFHQHYAITRHLGEGSYSTVKQVTHRKKGGFYACKIVDKLSLSDVDRAALSHEVRVLSSVSHVNIMRLYEVIEDDAKCYLVTELAEGGDLFDRIVKQGKFPEREAQKVAAALVEALHYCHMHSIIHRDVKPENVLLSGDDVKLCDFGFARQLNHQEDQASDSCGTPGYAAPEILDGRSYGLEVDVFSLGVVTYIMLCGYPPFPMKLAQLRTHRFNVRYPSKDWAAIHPDVKTLISKMLHVDPKERPSMAVLRCHPWIQAGRLTLERLRGVNEERRRLADLTRRQQAASAIRKKLVMGGFEAVKYGRNGLPHRTKLRLSTDGKVLSWQPKLLKRSLLRYQNARSFTSLFGIGKDNNGTSQPDLHAVEPETNRIPTGGVVGTPNNEHDDSEQSANAASPPHSTDSSPSSSTSDAINEKRLWWRSLRRERGAKTERTASGGFTLNFATRQTGSTPSSPVTPPAAKTLRMRSSSPTTDQHPMTPSATSPDRLDDSIKLHDIRHMLVGDNAPFFAGHATNLPNTAKRAVDPACVLSVCTRFRELHLEFPNEGIRDGFMYLLQQATLPLPQFIQSQPPRLLKSTSTPPPPPQNLSSRGYDAFVPMTPPDEESKMLSDDVLEAGGDEHSSRPEVDDEDAETVAKQATAAVSNNQDE
ncbi:putative myosin light chain kinase [Phytophthora ramorum]|nr:putative myosin light chain kinase [Phytophthora ramorum]